MICPVIGPVLANLFLHYVFDEWMRRNHSEIKFERYADDTICSSGIWYLLIFAATWLTMALAMIMTGNIIVGILGFGVFASYFPIVIYNIFPLYAGSFFSTYSGNTADNVVGQQLKNLIRLKRCLLKSMML